MTKHFSRILLCMLALLFAQSAQASLTLVVDTVNELFAITGSDSGLSNDYEGSAEVIWEITGIGNPGGLGAGVLPSYDNTAFTVAPGTVGDNEFGVDLLISSTAGSEGNFAIALYSSTPGAITINGTGVFQSYASLDVGAKTRLAGAIGQSMSLDVGSGFDEMNIAAVPEPHHAAILLGLMVLLPLARRARRG